MFAHLVFAISLLLGCCAASLVPKLKTFGTGRSAFRNAGPEHSIFNYTLSSNGQFGACYVTYFQTIRILSDIFGVSKYCLAQWLLCKWVAAMGFQTTIM